MTSAFSPPQVVLVKPPTPDEIDLLATISAVCFVLGVLAFACVIGAALAVALRTQLPGRWSVLLSLVLLSAWWGFERFMGGSLEMPFGFAAELVTYTVYSVVALVFSLGYLRMCFRFFRQHLVRADNR